MGRQLWAHLAPCGTGHVDLIMIKQYVVEMWKREKLNEPCAVEGHRKEEMERVRSVQMVEACLPPGAMVKSFCVPIKHKTYFHRRIYKILSRFWYQVYFMTRGEKSII